MHIPRTRKPGRQRLPITIALDPTAYAFVEKCASEGWFRSVDDFFEATEAGEWKAVDRQGTNFSDTCIRF